jgi:AcrR family transcriptional regulator
MKRAEQRDATRRLVLDKAARLCTRTGFLRTRTVDIATAAGLSHGAIFVHFATRELLFQEVVAGMGRRITDRLYQLVSDGAGVAECLKAQLQCLEEQEGLYRRLVIENALLTFDARTVWTSILSAISVHLCDALEREMRQGTIRRAPLHLVLPPLRAGRRLDEELRRSAGGHVGVSGPHPGSGRGGRKRNGRAHDGQAGGLAIAAAIMSLDRNTATLQKRLHAGLEAAARPEVLASMRRLVPVR